jgi:hypothetical protein
VQPHFGQNGSLPLLAQRILRKTASAASPVLQAKQLKTRLFCPKVCEPPVQFTVYKRAAAIMAI